MNPWLVLLNPAAGRKPVTRNRVEAALQSAGVEYRLEEPSSPTAMSEAVLNANRRGENHLAVVGGDGTANLIANAILSVQWAEPPVLGVLPGGTGCDLLRTFALPQSLEQAATHLVSDSTYLIDVGRLEGDFGVRHFLNVAQAGVGAAAAESVNGWRREWGKARYPLAFVQRLPGFPNAEVKLTSESGRRGQTGHESRALAVIFANAQYFAGGWNVAPRANLSDGRLDVQVINTAKTRAPVLVPKIIRGVHLADPAVRRFSWSEGRLETNPTWPVEADGELVGNTPVSVSVLPGALLLKI